MVSDNDFKETGLGPIPEDWDLKRLEDIAEVNERNINKVFNSDLIRYIDVSSVDNGIIKEIKEVKLEEAPSRAKRIVRNNDILISTVRPNLKHFAYVKESKPNTVASTGFAVISAKKISPNFLYYYLTTDNYTKYLISIADSHTSTYPAFNPDVIEKSFVPYPSLSEQNSIAQILSNLDSKIELNQRMNQTLEEIGRAIFKHWFVDFEFPDEQGRPYKSSGGEMVDSELGEIPKGWELSFLPEVSKIVDCLHTKKPDTTLSDLILLQVYNINEDGTLNLTKKYTVSDSDYKEWTKNILLKEGDCLITNAGRVGAVGQVPSGFVGGIGRNITAIRPVDVKPTYLLRYLFSKYGIMEIKRLTDDGTVLNSLNVRGIKKIRILIPPEDILDNFELIARSLRKKVEKNNSESDLHSDIRDSLLPKLMSGKIRVKGDE